jgi:Glycosyltransferase family 87
VPKKTRFARIRRLCLALLVVGLLAVPGAAPASASPRTVTTSEDAKAVFLAHPKVARWMQRYPRPTWVTTARFRPKLDVWQVSVFSGKAGQTAEGKVDRRGQVVEAWVGPEVAWPLARGDGLGGVLNRPLVWLSFSLFFLVGLANLRKPFCLRNLDLLVFLSFSIYLWYFNEGRVFASVAAASIPLLYLIARCAWIGWTNRASPAAPALPVWLLVAATVLLVGFRVGLNTEQSGVLDVGYAGVIGADRLAHGETPYGNFPVKDTGRPCGPATEDGDIGDWVQANGRCETANHLGDTYGPVNYHAYLPGLAAFGWSGKWDDLPAVHFTTILFDLLAILGLAAVGFRFGGARLAALLAFAWAANPFTQYLSSSNTNDAIMPVFLIWGFWAASSNLGRGVFAALGAWTKLAALVVIPLWATYPNPRDYRRATVFAAAFIVTTVLCFWALILGGNPIEAFRVFYERTFEMQLDRQSPFSPWDWGHYHAQGIPDLKWLQQILQVALVAAALAVAFVPRHKSPLQLAALTGALLMGFELVLTHWAALYIAWFFPFLVLAVVAGTELGGVVPERARAPGSSARERGVEVGLAGSPASAMSSNR